MTQMGHVAPAHVTSKPTSHPSQLQCSAEEQKPLPSTTTLDTTPVNMQEILKT